jgi:hypothetical protein
MSDIRNIQGKFSYITIVSYGGEFDISAILLVICVFVCLYVCDINIYTG